MLFTDQLNRKIELTEIPKRIISLVPSQTELLYDLSLRDEVVGITKFCIHPEEWFTNKVKVGGTKNIDFERVKNLNPDLIIANKEENEKDQIEELMNHYSVWLSDINTLKDAYNMITSIGTLVGKQQEAMFLKLEIESNFNTFINIANKLRGIKVACFIWKKPYMVVGENTFINSMLNLCGFKNVFANKNQSRYPEINPTDLIDANPEVILLLTEPYPFKEKHIAEFKKLCPDAKIVVVDGEMFSWYGSRLLQAPHYYTNLIQSIL